MDGSSAITLPAVYSLIVAERQSLKAEREELTRQCAAYRTELSECHTAINTMSWKLESVINSNAANLEINKEKEQKLFTDIAKSNSEVINKVNHEKTEHRIELAKLAVQLEQHQAKSTPFTTSGPRGASSVYDPESTVLILGVTDRQFLNDSGPILRRTLSKTLKDIRFTCVSAQRTIRGALQFQFKSKEEAQAVIAKWEPGFYGGGTTARSPGSVKRYEAAIKCVPHDISDEFLDQLLSEDLQTASLLPTTPAATPPAKCRRMMKGGSPLNTVKVVFNTDAQLQHCINNGVYIHADNLHLTVNIFYPSQAERATRCHNCQSYGHTTNICTKPQRCARCGAEGHSHWPAKGHKCEQPANCCHCNTAHEASSPNCDKFKKVKEGLAAKAKQQPRHNPLSR